MAERREHPPQLEHGNTYYIGVIAAYRLDEERRFSLDRVRPRFAERLAGLNVRGDLALGEFLESDVSRNGRDERFFAVRRAADAWR